MTGAEAGLVVVSADDPSMHSSQNEQDNRRYAKFARVPCLEPANSQEAKDFAVAAFDLSEQFDTPVVLRLTTRICHTTAPVELGTQRDRRPIPEAYRRDPAKYVMVPANARGRHPVVEQRIRDLAELAETFALNRIEERGKDLGIVTAGVAYQHAREVFPEASILKLGLVYPLPRQMIASFAKSVERLIVLEELDPFIEEEIRLMGIELYNPNGAEYPNTKTIFPLIGELNPRIVREHAVRAGLLSAEETEQATPALAPGEDSLPSRPPVLCPGCPHRSTFYILHKLGLLVNGDIGCYALGVVPPLSAMHTCGCMGASIGVAHGAAKAGSKEKHVAVIGDSTFFHTGIPALIDVAYNRGNTITIIMDNRTTAMTGQQENPGTGKTLQGEDAAQVHIEALVRAIGIKHVAVVDAHDVKTIEKTLKEWMELDEPAVMITEQPCILLPEARRRWMSLRVDSEKCNGCALCFRIGCPAIVKSEELDPRHKRPLAKIDPLLCTGCEICAQICPRSAILTREQMAADEETSEAK
jgi:indolepyruvate ferredoxin oxidoreductase alpha subunit